MSNNTVVAIREQEWQQVAARKERITAQCERNATLSADRITRKLESSDDIPLNLLVPVHGVSVDKMLALRGDVSLRIQHEILPPVQLKQDDFIAYCVAITHADEEQRQWLKSIGPHGFALARSRHQQAQSSQKVIEAEIVTDATVGHAGDPSARGENAAQKEG